MKNLISEQLIISSDEDQPVVQDLVIGFDTKFNLIISITHTDYDNERKNCSTSVVLLHNESMRLARRLKVHHYQLPQYIAECMSEWKELTNPSLKDVQDCFDEMIECILNEGCKFRIRRIFDRRGRACC